MPEKLLAEKLLEEQKEAMRAGNRFRLSVIRMLRAEMQNARIAKKAELDGEEELAILSREVKRRQEALVEFEKADRPELVESLKQEIEILKEYLPAQLSADELEEVVKEAIRESGAETKKEMGKVMGLLMPRVKGKADGTVVRGLVEKYLG